MCVRMKERFCFIQILLTIAHINVDHLPMHTHYFLIFVDVGRIGPLVYSLLGDMHAF